MSPGPLPPSPESQACNRRLFDLLQSYQAQLRDLMHDGLCQSLGSALLMARAMENQPPTDAVSAFREIGALLETALEDARDVAHRLRPVGPEPGALMDALAELARTSPVPCAFVCEDPWLQRDATDAVALYRLAEAALSQAVKAPGVAHLTLTLRKAEKSGTLRITIAGETPDSWDYDTSVGILAMVAGAETVADSSNLSRCWRFPYAPR